MAHHSNCTSRDITNVVTSLVTDASYIVSSTPIKYTKPVPITPMPKYDELDTPEIQRLASKYGMKRKLGKTRLKTKLMEVYLYNHQVHSPSKPSPCEKNDLHQQSISMKSKSDGEIGDGNTSDLVNDSLCFDRTPTLGNDSMHGCEFNKLNPVRSAKYFVKDSGSFTEEKDGIPGLHSTFNKYQATTHPNQERVLPPSTNLTKLQTTEVEEKCLNIPTISLLDSSTDSNTSVISLCADGTKSSIANPGIILNNNGQIDVPEHTGNEECIDLTCFESYNERSVSDIFNVSVVDGINANPVADNLNINDGKAESLDVQRADSLHDGSSEDRLDEDNSDEMYAEREKFHQSVFGSFRQDSSSAEESGEECVSLLQRIMRKKSQCDAVSQSEAAVSVELSGKPQLCSVDKVQCDTPSPPKKARKAQRVSTCAPEKPKKSKLSKENLEIEMCNAIRADRELHTRILLYTPIYLSQFKLLMKERSIQVSVDDLRDFLDSKGITFSTADENRHNGPRVVRKKSRTKNKQ